MNPGATDEEILGLTTNVRRRDSTGSHRPAEGDAGPDARASEQLETDFADEQRGQATKADSSSSRSTSPAAVKTAVR